MNNFLERRRALKAMRSLLPASCRHRSSAQSRMLKSYRTAALQKMATTARDYDEATMRFIADALGMGTHALTSDHDEMHMVFVVMVAPVSMMNPDPTYRMRNTSRAFDDCLTQIIRNARKPITGFSVDFTRGVYLMHSLRGLLMDTSDETLTWYGVNYEAIQNLRVEVIKRSAYSVDDLKNLINAHQGNRSLALAEGVL